jgi:glyoxylase-like metal-dependent hydrolase (beta-lactamase superfamily II)
MMHVVPRELPAPPSLDRFVQFDRIGKGALGYVLVSDGEALVIDPPRRAQAYVEAARDAGARIVGVADTHVHADYLSGGPTISRSLGVPYYLHPSDNVDPYLGSPGRLEFDPLRDGASIRVGRARVEVRHTPGHTEGSTSFLIGDHAALTGDFVFVASIGRPDLAGKQLEWTELLWNSLETAKHSWPDGIRIHPAHYVADEEREPDHSIGRPWRRLLHDNAALRLADRESFIAWVNARQAPFPDNYRRIKVANVGLLEVSEAEAQEWEVGKSECALGGMSKAASSRTPPRDGLERG